MRPLRILIFCFIALIACKKDKRNDIPDVSKIDSKINFFRFERDLFAIDTNKIQEGIQGLFNKYPILGRIYFQDIMQFCKNVDSLDSKFYADLKALTSDPLLRMIQYRTDSIYGDMADLKTSFEKTAAYAEYYFPERNPVEVYTMISAFNVGNIIFPITDSLDGLGISMDFFQGNGFNYKEINPSFELFSNYITKSFNKDHLLKKSWTPWVEDILEANNLNTLLDNMIFEGKKLYILGKIIPNVQDSVLYEFTPDQVKWCDENKMDIWSFLKEKEFINSTKRNEIVRYLNPSPSSPGMPKESPGRAAVFIGLDIVRAFMVKHPEYSMKELINEKNAQKILDEAKYKPKNG